MTDGEEEIRSTERPALIVWCVDMQAGEPILGALQQRFDLDVRANLPDIIPSEPVATNAFEEASDILLLCLSSTEILCRAMKGNVLPSAALKGWLEQTQAIMQLNRRNRRKVHILDIDMAIGYPGAFLRWCGLPEDNKQIAALSRTGQQDRDEILHLLVQHILLGDLPARTLQGELDAASLNFADATDSGANDPEATFLAYQDIRKTREQVALLQAQNRAVQNEAEAQSKHRAQLEQDLELAGEEAGRLHQQDELLQAQNQLMQQELEVLAQGKAQLEQRLVQLSQGIESYQVQVSELRSERSGLERKAADKDRALLQAGAMLRDLEAQAALLTQNLNRAGVISGEKQLQIYTLDQKLQQFMSSRSYRLTAPLRRLRALVSTRRPV